MTSRNRPRLRTVLRNAHLVTALPLVAYVYGPDEVVGWLEVPLRLVLLPMVIVSGLVMWQLPTLRRAAARRRAANSS